MNDSDIEELITEVLDKTEGAILLLNKRIWTPSDALCYIYAEWHRGYEDYMENENE
jgi:hypothetical protein